MNKLSVLMLLAGVCFGSAFTMLVMSDRLDEAADYVAKATVAQRKAECRISNLEDQLNLTRAELQEAIDAVPPNASQCWAQFRKIENRKSFASR